MVNVWLKPRGLTGRGDKRTARTPGKKADREKGARGVCDGNVWNEPVPPGDVERKGWHNPGQEADREKGTRGLRW